MKFCILSLCFASFVVYARSMLSLFLSHHTSPACRWPWAVFCGRFLPVKEFFLPTITKCLLTGNNLSIVLLSLILWSLYNKTLRSLGSLILWTCNTFYLKCFVIFQFVLYLLESKVWKSKFGFWPDPLWCPCNWHPAGSICLCSLMRLPWKLTRSIFLVEQSEEQLLQCILLCLSVDSLINRDTGL